MAVSESLKGWLVKHDYVAASVDDEFVLDRAVKSAISDGTLSQARLKAFELADDERKAANFVRGVVAADSPTAGQVFGDPRVKKPSERYSSTKSAGKHVRTGEPVRDEHGKTVELPSELDNARSGALLKFLAGRSGMNVSLNEHEKQLLDQCFAEEKWCGSINGGFITGVDGMQVKALLSDATSGGTELVPEFFDANVVTFPLLHSELVPKVDLRDVPKGNSVETASVSTPTATWGVGEGTAMTPFDTSGIVAGIDTTLHPVTCAVELGRDLLADTPIDLGRILTELVGQRLMAELDRVIALGNGTSEPEGIFTASSLTDIGNPAGGDGAAPQVNDYEALLFAVGKQYRNPTARCCFLANDTTYSRCVGIPVGTADARRVFGMLHSHYRILEHDFVINNNVANNQAAFGAMSRYRLYRRQGLSIRFETGGRELGLKNLALMIARGRYGGRVMDANAFAFSDNFEA
ncbi:MAG: phage major capsid protein [Planctomycetaceae bacterium]|nr:phage major capsid protein [Planctomycetaceae bacterium]